MPASSESRRLCARTRRDPGGSRRDPSEPRRATRRGFATERATRGCWFRARSASLDAVRFAGDCQASHARTRGKVPAMALVHGGRLVAQALKRHGVTHLFTLCGGHIQAIYDGCLDEDIRVVDVRHEQTAGHAADGYARVTGRPGVCAVTAGPGVTDVVTAVANAQRAGVPIVVIGGTRATTLHRMGFLH